MGGKNKINYKKNDSFKNGLSGPVIRFRITDDVSDGGTNRKKSTTQIERKKKIKKWYVGKCCFASTRVYGKINGAIRNIKTEIFFFRKKKTTEAAPQ